MKIKAVLFDLDGTLLDTTEFVLQAYEHVLHNHKLPTKPRAIVSSLIGKHIKECYQILTGLEKVEHLIASHFDFQDRHYHLATPYEDTLYTLERLKKNGIKQAVITTRYGPSVVETLKRSQIFD